MDREAQIALIRDHVQREYVNWGMCADICIHDPKGEDPNPHAHVMFTMRPISPDGTWGDKSRREYILDKQGQKIPLAKGDFKSRRIDIMGWDDRGNAEKWRAAWECDVNREYERRGIERPIDMRSYKRQGLDLEPTQHMGPEIAALEKRGEKTVIGTRNREKQERNAIRRERGRHIRNLDEKQMTRRGQEPTPTFDEWQQGREPQREHPRGLERGR